jgi:hypothetical protein
MSTRLLLDRRRTGAVRAVGALTTLLPLGLGAYLVLRSGSVGLQIVGVLLLLVGLLITRTNLSFVGGVEIDGDQAVIKALWSGAKRTVDLRRLAAVEARLGRRPGDGAIVVLSYLLLFEDGDRVFLGEDFDHLEEGVSHAIRAASPDAVVMPVRAGEVRLGLWHRYLKDPRLGCSGTYPQEDRVVSVYAYRGDAAEVPDGVDSPEVVAEIAKAEGDIRAAAGGEPAEVGRGIVGEDGSFPMRWTALSIAGPTDPRLELVLLRGHRGALFKVRHTRRPQGDAATAQAAAEEVRSFAAEVAAAAV